MAVAHHVDMGDASVKKLAADHGKAKALVERAGMHLGAEHLLLEAALFGLADGGAQQGVANFQAAPVLENGNPADMAIW